MRVGHTHRVGAAELGLTPRSGICASEVTSLLGPPCRCAACEASQGCSVVVRHLQMCCFYGPWEGLPCRPRSAPAFDRSGLPGRSCELTRGWSLPLLGPEASGRGRAETGCWSPPEPSMGWLSRRTSVPQNVGPPADCLRLHSWKSQGRS